ncbi:unnamed protein product [Merluccius merluccius]
MQVRLRSLGPSCPVSTKTLTPLHSEPSRSIMRRKGTGEDRVSRTCHGSPYISGLIHHLGRRFQNLNIIGAFSILGPQAVALTDEEKTTHLQTLAKRFLPGKETVIFQEWQSFKEHMRGGGAFKVDE